MKALRNVFPLTNLSKLGLGVLAMVLTVSFLCWPRSPKEALVIINGEPYKLLSYGTAQPQLSGGTSFEAFVMTVTYEDQQRGLTRGTIMVPKMAVRRDPSLDLNTVVWDQPISLEGKTYGVVRWNPAHEVPAREHPPLIAEKPLTRKVD